MQLTININPNFGNQQVRLSDNTIGQLAGIRAFGSSMAGNQVIQWTFISTGHFHEGFVVAGQLQEGQVIKSVNGNDEYKVHFTKN